MKDELNTAGIWTSGTTFHIKPGCELPVELLENALRSRMKKMVGG